MEAGLSSHVWGIEGLIALLPKPTVSGFTIEKELLQQSTDSKGLTVIFVFKHLESPPGRFMMDITDFIEIIL
jgi:hypothetical protein